MKYLYYQFLFIIVFTFFQTQLFSASIELYGNYHTMGIIISLENDEDPENDAIATIQYRQIGQEFQEGFAATRTNDIQFVGSLFWLEPDMRYEVVVTIIDSTTNTFNGTVLKASSKTRKQPVLFDSKKSYFVSINGSGDLFTESNPGAIAEAVKLVKEGEEIVLLGGVYYTGGFVFAHEGTEESPITIRAFKGENVVFDGSDTINHIWEDRGNGIYSTNLIEENTQLVLADARRLYGYNSYSDLENLKWDLDGFYVDGDTLFVKIAGKNPNNIDMIISKQHVAFTLWNRDYFQFRNLTFRYYGQNNWAKALYFYNSSYNVIDRCTFALNNMGIGIKSQSNQITIQNCEFYDDTDMWDWNSMKASIVESTLLTFYDPVDGRGHVIRDNIFHDCQDGMSPGSFYKEQLTTELDIYNNTIYNAGDDGISVDGWASNVRVWNNTIHDVLVGISFAPINKGPAYAIRNIIYNTGYGNSEYRGMSFKFNSGGYGKSGVMYLFHNTTHATIDGVDGFECRIPGEWELIYSRNNAFTGNRYAHSYIRGDGDRLLNMDYDNLYTTDDNKFSYWYNSGSQYYLTLQDFQTATNLELNGISKYPMFVSTENGKFDLQQSSPLIDKAMFIPGINDGFIGDNPDIGAIEKQTSLEIVDFSLNQNLEVFIYPNPTESDFSIVLKDNDDMIDEIEIFDILGNRIMARKKIGKRSCGVNSFQFESGIYFVNIRTENGESFTKSITID